MNKLYTNELISPDGVTYTNNSNINKEAAIFAMFHDSLYTGGKPREGKLSTTTVIGPIRKALLSIKNPTTSDKDVATMMASSRGTALHEQMARALTWMNIGYKVEQRGSREIAGWKISGEYDVITPDGVLKDLKFVSNYSYVHLKEEQDRMTESMSMEELSVQFPTVFKYMAQLSIYRWIFKELDLQPYASILFMFNNGTNFGQIPSVDIEVRFPTFPYEEVESYLTDKINIIKQHIEEGTLPLCTPAERGTTQAEYKVKRMNKTGKYATVAGSKFNNRSDVDAFLRNKGRAGDIVDETPASHKLCNYCPHYGTTCDQI